MFSDRFTLYDEKHNKILSRYIVAHIQWAIIEHGLLEGNNVNRCYLIVSDVSGYVMSVNKDTTTGEWREYAYKCSMALD